MFGTSGIRGIVGKGITCPLLQKIGLAIGKPGSKIILARDTRGTSAMLANSFASGAMQAGSQAVGLGIAPTPALAYATKKSACFGAMITASHNPSEYNGIKLFENGMEIGREREEGIERKLNQKTNENASWEKSGALSADSQTLPEYESSLLSIIDKKAISRKKPKIAIDCANGAASQIAQSILSSAGCKLITLNCNLSLPLDAKPEPTEANLKSLSSLIKKEKADFGIAFDPDADRAVILDSKGKLLGLDRQLAIMCAYLLQKKKGKIITTVEASLLVRETVEKCGGRLIITPVGSMHVSFALKKNSAIFGGEPCGEYVFSDSIPAADGLLTALKFAEIHSCSPALFSSPSFIPKYPIIRKKFPCKDKSGAMEKITRKIKITGTKNILDGLRIDFPGGWLLIRPSGTEPAIRLTLECKDGKRLKILQKELEGLIVSSLGS